MSIFLYIYVSIIVDITVRPCEDDAGNLLSVGMAVAGEDHGPASLAGSTGVWYPKARFSQTANPGQSQFQEHAQTG